MDNGVTGEGAEEAMGGSQVVQDGNCNTFSIWIHVHFFPCLKRLSLYAQMLHFIALL